jgi:uncharacterized protein (TIGR00375 family)
MKLYADLHIHSRYSRACSPELVPENLALWGKRKGIRILGTGDFTHPGWQEMLDQSLEEKYPGLYGLKNNLSDTLFVYQTEIASIYKQGEKVRRVHNLIFAPNRQAATGINTALERLGCNLKSDGRPIIGVHNADLVKLIKDVDPNCELIPAHIWTPHFGAFGSMSGFDSLEEGYGSEYKLIWAVETGISSDPPMAWRVGALDGIRLISNSDPHSLRRLGREANVLELEPKDFSYQGLMQALKGHGPGQLQHTVEFFPEEGRYHFDGHDACGFSCSPTESRRLKSLCPICGKKLTLGTLHRVDALASQLSGSEATVDRVPYKHTLQLEEVIASSLGVGSSSKKVQTLYMQVTDQRPEFEILFDLSESELSALLGPSIGQDLMRVRRGQVKLEPGFDGRYGKVSILKKSSDLFAIAG